MQLGELVQTLEQDILKRLHNGNNVAPSVAAVSVNLGVVSHIRSKWTEHNCLQSFVEKLCNAIDDIQVQARFDQYSALLHFLSMQMQHKAKSQEWKEILINNKQLFELALSGMS